MSAARPLYEIHCELGIRLEIMRICQDRSIPDAEALKLIHDLEREITRRRYRSELDELLPTEDLP